MSRIKLYDRTGDEKAQRAQNAIADSMGFVPEPTKRWEGAATS